MFSIVPCSMIKLMRNRMSKRVCRRGLFFLDIFLQKTPTTLFFFSDSICIVSIKSGLCVVSSSMLQTSCYKKSQTETMNNNVPEFLRLFRSFDINEKSKLMQTCHKENDVQSKWKPSLWSQNNDKFSSEKQSTEQKNINSALMAFAKFEWI